MRRGGWVWTDSKITIGNDIPPHARYVEWSDADVLRDGVAPLIVDPQMWEPYTAPNDREPVPGCPGVYRVKTVMRWRRKRIRSTEYGYA